MHSFTKSVVTVYKRGICSINVDCIGSDLKGSKKDVPVGSLHVTIAVSCVGQKLFKHRSEKILNM